MSRAAAVREAKMLSGQLGADGAPVEEAQLDPEQIEQAKAKEALYRGRTWLGREALTWWLYRSESTEPLAMLDDQPVSLNFYGRLTLRAAQGDITEVSLKGQSSPYAALSKRGLSEGLLVHGARLKLTWGEQVFHVSLDAEHFDLKSAKLPEVLESEDDGLAERLELVGRLTRALDACLGAFAQIRTSKKWKAEVAAMKEWLADKPAPVKKIARA